MKYLFQEINGSYIEVFDNIDSLKAKIEEFATEDIKYNVSKVNFDGHYTINRIVDAEKEEYLEIKELYNTTQDNILSSVIAAKVERQKTKLDYVSSYKDILLKGVELGIIPEYMLQQTLDSLKVDELLQHMPEDKRKKILFDLDFYLPKENKEVSITVASDALWGNDDFSF